MISRLYDKDLMAGLLFGALGVSGIALSLGYTLGSASRMGPGYVPLVFSIGLTVMALIIIVVTLRRRVPQPDEATRWSIRPLLCVMTGIALFGLSITDFGLLLASAMLMLCCAFAAKGINYRAYALTAVVLIAAVTFVFVYGVGVRIDLLPKMISLL